MIVLKFFHVTFFLSRDMARGKTILHSRLSMAPLSSSWSSLSKVVYAGGPSTPAKEKRWGEARWAGGGAEKEEEDWTERGRYKVPIWSLQLAEFVLVMISHVKEVIDLDRKRFVRIDWIETERAGDMRPAGRKKKEIGLSARGRYKQVPIEILSPAEYLFCWWFPSILQITYCT
jgi:hypothetical protein